MDAKVYELINDQINKELYSAYLYLSFADYYEEEGLSGYANYFEIQAQEERDHAMIFRNYLHENGEAVKLLAIDMPDKTFANFLEPLEAAMEHEKYVTSLINDIYAAALEAHDYRAQKFLGWFIDEQLEEEDNADTMITNMKLFGGDPMWITEAVGGIGEDGRHMVTKNSYRMLNTLYNLNAAAEPNLTVLWSENLPENWKKFIAKVSIDTDALQYENDDVMRPYYGDDYAIACCVSAMRVGKDMQFFGARANIAKLMMMAINGGRDENKFEQVGPEMPVMDGDVLDYEEVLRRMDFYRPWLAKTYVSAMNTIHYMHDKYAYEKSQMALHDTEVCRLMAFGIAGMSCMADSLSAIKYAKVKPVRNPENGIIVDFEIEGDFPKFGNDDDRVDQIACEQVEKFYQALTQFPLYRGAIHTMSILTITSNVMYGKKTGNTPDGRRHGEPLAPGANPMSGRDVSGALASLNSVAKLSYTYCRDGISNTFSITPGALGKTEDEQVNNLVSIMGGYFAQNAHHLNVNVLNRETLMAAYEHPEQYPNLTIRVSGYAVNFYKLSREQQREVISRTFHEAI